MGKYDEKYYRKLIIILIFSILVGVLVIIVNHLGFISLLFKVFKALLPVLLAIILSFLFEPLILKLEKYKIKRAVATLMIYIGIAVLFFLILILFIPPFIEQIQLFSNNLPSILDGIELYIGDFLKSLGLNDVKTIVYDAIYNYSSTFFHDLEQIVSDILYYSMAYVGALFLSFDFKSFKRGLKRLLPHNIKRPVLEFSNEYVPFIYKYLSGILYNTFILWALASIAFTIVSLDYPLVYGLIVALFNLVPVIGSYIGGVPAILVALSISTEFGLSVFVAVLIVQLLESNFINPYIMKNVIELHPLEGLLSLLLLGSLFGFIGMVISPLFWVGVKLIYKQYKIRHRHKKNLNYKNN